MKKLLFSVFLCFTAFQSLQSQMVWENYQVEVYNYLGRLSQKGIIRFDDLILPLTRQYIQTKLTEVKEHTVSLSRVEKKELNFYLQEYNTSLFTPVKDSVNTAFFKKDTGKRWRAFTSASPNFYITADPILQGSENQYNTTRYQHKAWGVDVWGQIGKHIGFQFAAKDITENRDGNPPDSFNYKGPQTGFILLGNANNYTFTNYSVYRGHIGYMWKNGSISVGQDYLLWGYGENGRMVLSDKSPAYPYIRLDYHPLPWLQFNYEHAWLGSNILDSAASYNYNNNVFGGVRNIYIKKFMATHSITVTLKKGIDFSLGESVIYTDHVNIGFLIPIMYFKLYDNNVSNNNILAGSNGQAFMQLSLKNIPHNMHLYSTLFIDEIRVSQIFNRDSSRNQIGFNFGASITDFPIRYLSLSAEYTRVNPFVYQNLNPAQTYTNQGFYLGDWMGNNFDRLIFSLKYTPAARVKCLLRYQYIRKGLGGTADQQYFQYPEPSFLTPLIFTQKQYYLNISYEWKHNIYMVGNYNRTETNNISGAVQSNYNNYSIGLNFGL